MKENQTVEFKESWREDFLKTACAFANTEGGRIFIGVDDKGNVIGLSFSAMKKYLEDIPNQAISKLGLAVGVKPCFDESLEYLVVEVPKSYKPVSYNGVAYIRSGSTTQRLDFEQMNRLWADRTGTSWDCSYVDGVRFEDLDEYHIRAFRDRAIEKGRLSASVKDGTLSALLENLQLTEEGSCTRAAVLLFHPCPQRYINGSDTHIGRFSNDERLLFQDMVEGPLMHQIKTVTDLLLSKYLVAPVSYEGFERVEMKPVPEEALREAVYNALAHNDYSQGVSLQIKVYDDRVELTNSCILPVGWTLETLVGAHRSMPMNNRLASAFYRAGYIERWGSGIPGIFKAARDYGCRAPQYYQMDTHSLSLRLFYRESKVTNNSEEVTNNSEKVTNNSEKVTNNSEKVTNNSEKVTNNSEKVTNNSEKVTNNSEKVTNPSALEKQIINRIRENPTYTQGKLSLELNVSRKTINLYMKKLEEKGLLRREGNTKALKWAVCEIPENYR